MFQEVENKWLRILEEELNAEMRQAPMVVASHDAAHVNRVWKNAKQIGQDLDLDEEVLVAAVFLHDLGRHYPEGQAEHGPISAPLARRVLDRIGFPADKVERVVNAIRYHDETFPASARSSLEAKVLYDADKLEALGAVGIARYLVFNAWRGKTLREIVDYVEVNLPVRFESLELDETRQLAKERYDYAVAYFQRLKQELGYLDEN
jgi:uncharacterized protein